MSLDGLDKILANSPLARERLLHSGRLAKQQDRWGYQW